MLMFSALQFCQEMKARDADFYFVSYGKAAHGFTEPMVNKFGKEGLGYNKTADVRSWAETTYFLNEVFNKGI